MSTTDDTPTESTEQPTDQIEALREEIDQLHLELAKARQRITDLEERVESSSTLPPAASDWRDARVLDALEEGDYLSVTEFRDLIKSRTDVREQETVTERLKGLVKSDAFETAGTRRWRYIGSTGGDR